MNSKNLRNLFEAYSSVYEQPQEKLNEEQIWEEVENWVNSLIEEGYDLSDYTWEEMYEAYMQQIPGVPRVPTMRDMIKKGNQNQLNQDLNRALFRASDRLLRGGSTIPSSSKISPAAAPASRPAAAPASRPAAAPASRPAAAPASRPAAAPASRPAVGAPRPLAAKPAAPTRASSPANASTAEKIKGGTQVYDAQRKAGDFKGASETGSKTWASANPSLANKPKTPNPLMQKTFGYQTGGAPGQTPKPFSGSAENMSRSISAKTGVTGGNTPQNSTQKAKTGFGGLSSDYNWGSNSKVIEDFANAYTSVYEAKKVDQDEDGDNDFADIRIARMVASGIPKEEAIRRVKEKSYNKETKLDEAAKRTPKKVRRGAKDDKSYMAGRSDAGKRISGDEKTGPRYYTLGSARGAEVDSPTVPGAKPINTPKVSKSELRYARTRYKDVSGKDWNKVGGPKGLPEDFELWINELLDEGHDLSEYTLDEMYEIYEEYKPWDFGPKQKATAKYLELAARKSAGGSAPGTATRGNKIASVAREMRTTLDKDSARSGVNPAKQGLQPSTPRHTDAAFRGAGGGETARTKFDVKPLKSKGGGSSSLGGVGNASGSVRYTPGGGGRYGLSGIGLADDFELWINDLLDEGYDLSEYTLDEMYEIYEEYELNEATRMRKELGKRGEIKTRTKMAMKTSSGRKFLMTDVKSLSGRRYGPIAGSDDDLKYSRLAAKTEDFKLWINELLDEGYDLSEYTLDEMYEIYEETEAERAERIKKRRERLKELESAGRVMTPTKREAQKRAAKKQQEKEEQLERLATAALAATRGATARSSVGTTITPKPAAPTSANRRLSASTKKDTLASKADDILRTLKNEDFQLWVQELLDEGYDLDNWTNEELITLYADILNEIYKD